MALRFNFPWLVEEKQKFGQRYLVKLSFSYMVREKDPTKSLKEPRLVHWLKMTSFSLLGPMKNRLFGGSPLAAGETSWKGGGGLSYRSSERCDESISEAIS